MHEEIEHFQKKIETKCFCWKAEGELMEPLKTLCPITFVRRQLATDTNQSWTETTIGLRSLKL
jgi:hypothetical protein